MFDPKIINDMAKQFANSLPPIFKDLNLEVEKNFRAFMQSSFNKLDLVTRDEFDVQLHVLTKTRAKLELLEQQVALLEKNESSR